MKTEFKEIILESGEPAVSFVIRTNKGICGGLFNKEDNRIFVHLIEGEGAVKGLMNILINRFKTNKITFTPLINDNVKNHIRGEVKIMKADSPLNPYGEPFEYLECEWNG